MFPLASVTFHCRCEVIMALKVYRILKEISSFQKCFLTANVCDEKFYRLFYSVVEKL